MQRRSRRAHRTGTRGPGGKESHTSGLLLPRLLEGAARLMRGPSASLHVTALGHGEPQARPSRFQLCVEKSEGVPHPQLAMAGGGTVVGETRTEWRRRQWVRARDEASATFGQHESCSEGAPNGQGTGVAAPT
jgi:hypothetical protein